MAKSKSTIEDTAVDTTDTPAIAVGPQNPDLLYGDHLNQKFGNTPANPKEAGDLSEPTVLLIHTNNNMNGTVGNAYKTVPKEMVGDYARAGWAVAGPLDRANYTGDTVGIGEGATDDADGEKATKFNEDVAKGNVVVDPPAVAA